MKWWNLNDAIHVKYEIRSVWRESVWWQLPGIHRLHFLSFYRWHSHMIPNWLPSISHNVCWLHRSLDRLSFYNRIGLIVRYYGSVEQVFYIRIKHKEIRRGRIRMMIDMIECTQLSELPDWLIANRLTSS